MEFNYPLVTSKGGRMLTAKQFLKCYQNSFPVIYPKLMKLEDFMEFAEDYADYVCKYEKYLPSLIAKLEIDIPRIAFLRRCHLLNDINHNCMYCSGLEEMQIKLEKYKQRQKITFEESYIRPTLGV